MKNFKTFGVNINDWITFKSNNLNNQKYYGKLLFSYFVFKKTSKVHY